MKHLSTKHFLFIGMFILLIVNIIQAKYTVIIDDEAYYWMWSQRLAWGYYDHPPMVALWIYLGDLIFPNILGTRLLATFAYAGIFWICYEAFQIKTKRELGLLFIMLLSFVLFTPYGFVSTPDTPLLFFSFLYIWALKLFIEKSNIKHALFLGFCFAMILYSKYHGILVIVFSLLPILFIVLRKSTFYIAIAFGVLLYVPHILWQFENDFVSVYYHIVRRNVFNTFKISNSTDYLLAVLWTGAPLLIWHTFKSFFQKNTAFVRSLKGVFFGVVLFFFLTTLKRYIQSQWLLVATVPLFFLLFNKYRLKKEAHRWIFILGGITIFLFAVGRVYVMLPDPPKRSKYHGLKDCMIQAGEKNKGLAVWETYQEASLFKFFNRNMETTRYRTLENRESQFELWDDQEKINGRNVTYYSGYAKKGDDSILFERRGPRRVVLFYLDSVQATHKVKIETRSRKFINDSVELELKFTNNHEHSVLLTEDSSLQLRVNYMEEPYSFNTSFSRKLEMPEVELKPNESYQFKLKYLEHKKPGEYWYYPSLHPKRMPHRRQKDTEAMLIQVPEKTSSKNQQ